MTMPTSLHILLLEDQPADAELVLHELRRAGFTSIWQRVETEAEYLAALDPSLDLILADYALPQFDALRALELLRARGLDIPFIIVSGIIGEDRAVAAIQRGATDYLIKDRLARLGTAVENALQQRRLQAEKLRADRLLDASERRFRALIEYSSDGIALVGGDGIVRYASPPIERILGYTPESVVGQNSVGFVHPDDLIGFQAYLEALVQQPGNSTTVQCRARHADGGWRWIEMVANNLLAEPSVGAIVLNYRDITERIQAEQALRAAEAKYRTLIEHIPAIIYQAALDETSSTLYVNPQIETMLGFTQAEWLDDPQRWLKQLHPRDFDQVLHGLSRTHSADAPIRSEFRMLTRDGQVVWFDDEAVIVRDPDGRPLFLLGIMLDITARKQAEDQIHQLNAGLEQHVMERTAELARANLELQAEIAERTKLEAQIQRQAAQAVALADVSGMLAEAGHEIQPLFDVIADRVAQLIGDMAILSALSDDRQLMQVKAIGHVKPESGAFMRTLLPVAYPQGHGLTGQVVQTGQALLISEVRSEQIRDQINPAYLAYLDRFGMASLLIVPVRARGRILGTLGVVRDQPGRPYTSDDHAFLQNLADRAGLAIENALLFAAAEQARAEAQRANRAKSAFLASMSHELRTPLNAILGFTGTLLMRLPGPLNADQERQLTIVQHSGQHQLALINDLLDLARIESGSVDIQLHPVECQKVITSVTESLRPLADQKGLRFSVEMPAAPLIVRSDQRALSQILINLINNAIKFTDVGEVRVELARYQAISDERRIMIGNSEVSANGLSPILAHNQPENHSLEEAVVVRVCDTGIGIKAEDQARLFSEFGRIESAEAREREGTGLGLRLSRQLAMLLDARIELTSVPGSGSTFTLILPAA